MLAICVLEALAVAIAVNPGGVTVPVGGLEPAAICRKIRRSFGCQFGPKVTGSGMYGPDGIARIDMSKNEIFAGMAYGASSVRVPGVIVNAPPVVVAL